MSVSLWLGLAALLLSGQAAKPLTWESLSQCAQLQYEQGPGQAQRALSRAISVERERLPGRLQSVGVGAQADVPLYGRRGGDLEYMLTANATLILDDWPTLQRAVLDAQRDEQRALAALERWRFTLAVSDAYAQWWAASALLDHVQRDLQTLSEAVRRYQEAGQQSLSALDVLEVKVFVGRLELERAQLTERIVHGEAALRELISAKLCALPPSAHAPQLDALEGDPWAALSPLAAKHPEQGVNQAQRSSLQARAQAAGAQWPKTLQVGGQLTTAGADQWWWTQTLSITIPIANPGVAEAARLKVEVEASRAASQWQSTRLGAQWQAQSQRYRAVLETLKLEQERLLKPLQQRQSLLNAASAQGHIPALRALTASAELHEQEHLHLERLIALAISQHQAALLALVLSVNP